MDIKAMLKKSGSIIGLVVLFAVIACLNSSFIDPSNLKNLLRQVSINALISFGMTFVILTGGIDLSVGSILALSSALMGSFIKTGMDPIFAIVVACLIGAALGAVNGLVITYGKVAPFIATLATMTIFRGATLVYTNGNPISNLTDNEAFHAFGQGYVAGLPIPAVMMLIMFAILYFILHKTPLGRKTYAVGGNEKATKLSGINTNKVYFLAYLNMGLLAAIAGMVTMARLNSANPQAGTNFEMDAIGACFIGGASAYGGTGTVPGVIIGALLMGVLNLGMSIMGIDQNLQKVVKGLVLLAAVIFDVVSKRKSFIVK